MILIYIGLTFFLIGIGGVFYFGMKIIFLSLQEIVKFKDKEYRDYIYFVNCFEKEFSNKENKYKKRIIFKQNKK